MKQHFLWALLFVCFYAVSEASDLKSIQQFKVKPGNTSKENRINLQKAIDWSTTSGSTFYVQPTEDSYPVDAGIILKKNGSLICINGPTSIGTVHPTRKQPIGSIFKITDKEKTFIIEETGTIHYCLKLYENIQPFSIFCSTRYQTNVLNTTI